MIAHVPVLAFTAEDPNLPARDTLLDQALMRDTLGVCLGAERPVQVDDVAILRAKYRPGESLRVLYRIHVHGRPYLIASRARATGVDALYLEAVNHEVLSGVLRGVAVDRALRTVFWTFPNDRRLSAAAQSIADHPLLTTIFGAAPRVLGVVGYAPERAVVYKVTAVDSGRSLGIAKVFAPGGSEGPRDLLDALAAANLQTDAPVLAPRVLGSDASSDLLVVEAMSGQHLHDLHESALGPAFAALGSALGRLHALRTPRTLGDDDQFADEELRGTVARIAAARPDVADSARRLADGLAATRPSTVAPVWIHGDLNSRNWMAHDGSVGLIDFDQSTRGPAGVDVGGVLAWMRVRTLLRAWTPAQEQALETMFLRGYAGHRAPLTPREQLWYRGAALFIQRAGRAVTRVRQPHLAVLPDILSAATSDVEALRRV